MTSVFDFEDILFQIVINHEGQYSIWPDYKAVPNMRPLSLRQHMAKQAAQ